MKIIFLNLIIISIGLASLFSQPCGEVTNCPGGNNYPYKYCKYDLADPNNGRSVVRCTSDPWADPTWNPRKIENLPICIDANTFQSTFPTSEEVGGEVVFTLSSALDDLINACSQWNCLCGKQNDPCNCSIKIRFTKNWNELGDKDALAVAKTNYQPYYCKVNCDQSEIILNNSDDFTLRASGTTKYFFITDYRADKVSYSKINKVGFVYNFLQTVLHELGHTLGFDHYDDVEGTPNVGCNPPITGLMMKELGHATGTSFGLYRTDICMFKKLYCPDLVPVEEEFKSSKITHENYPNPASEYLNIEIFVSESNNIVSIVIFNQLGIQEKALMNVNSSDGKIKERIDVSSLPQGIYFVKVGDKVAKFVKM